MQRQTAVRFATSTPTIADPSPPSTFQSELRDALKWVYLTLSMLILFALIGSFADYQQVVTNGHPWLTLMKPCAGCVFCGMTRGFCAMSSGLWWTAVEWNRAAPWLYLACWLWTLTFLARLASIIRR